jgi:hypothetical protein
MFELVSKLPNSIWFGLVSTWFISRLPRILMFGSRSKVDPASTQHPHPRPHRAWPQVSSAKPGK